jgi:hypothetical protein
MPIRQKKPAALLASVGQEGKKCEKFGAGADLVERSLPSTE